MGGPTVSLKPSNSRIPSCPQSLCPSDLATSLLLLQPKVPSCVSCSSSPHSLYMAVSPAETSAPSRPLKSRCRAFSVYDTLGVCGLCSLPPSGPRCSFSPFIQCPRPQGPAMLTLFSSGKPGFHVGPPRLPVFHLGCSVLYTV